MLSHRPFLLLLCAVFAFASLSCKKEQGCTDPNASNYDPEAEADDGSCKYDDKNGDDALKVPDTYDFGNADYSAQTARIELLHKLAQKIGEAENGSKVTQQECLDIYRNNGVLGNSSADLAGKTFPGDTSMFMQWFNQVGAYSGKSAYVIGGYFVNDDSIELKQVVEKGLMGACFYYQATERHLENMEMYNNENMMGGGQGTERAHHFDQAFGYFGAPKDLSPSSPAEVGDNYSEEAWFWGKYCIEMNEAIGNLDPIFEAFLKGRTAIVNEEASKRKKAVRTIEQEWERLCAASLVHYIKETKADINNNDVPSMIHHWSEAFGFHLSLKYNTDRIISDYEWGTLKKKLGDDPNETDVQKLDDALNELQSIYGFTAGEMQNL
ncbi:MAG: DUF4856 domain-containing protein [Flavobacteriales bacterium]